MLMHTQHEIGRRYEAIEIVVRQIKKSCTWRSTADGYESGVIVMNGSSTHIQMSKWFTAPIASPA